MSTSLFLAWKKNLFSSPFRAKCLDDENEETVDESERTIAAAATESESSEEAPSVEVEFEAPPIAEVEFEEPPISEVEFEAPPIEEVEFEAPPVVEVEFEEPPVVEVEFEAPPVEEVEFEAPPVVEEFEAPPVVEEFEAPPVVEVEFEAPPVVEVEFEAMPSVEVEVEAPPSVEVEVEAPPSVEVEAPPIVEVEAPPIVEVETPPSVEVEAPPIEVKAPPTVEVKAPPSVEVKAPPSVKVKAPPSAGAAKAPPGDGVVKEFTGPIMSYVTSAQLAATACARFCPSKEPPPKEPPKEPVEEKEYSCEYGDAKYYALCAFGGLLSCGLTHTAVVPLDMVKCRIQVNPAKYKGIINGFRVTMAEEGTRALAKGWAPTFFGYSMQGVGKFGFYEAFKILYGNMLGEENSYLWRTSLYLAASASAEFFADIALCPMEAVKVRIQTQPGWSTTLREGAPRIFKEEGLTGFYKGLVPLWARQIPYTMMKFACFERTVEALYKHVVPKPRSECSKAEQLVVTFAAGYIAGVFCAVVSHPADTIVSKLNQAKGSNFVQVAKNLGFMGMWKGLFPRIIMIGTLTALQWFIYDSVKVAFRLPRPPPPEMPESLKKRLECEEDD